jgi:hypothetical protein
MQRPLKMRKLCFKLVQAVNSSQAEYKKCILFALLGLIHNTPCRAYAVPMPCRVNPCMPCRAPAILRQCRVLRESPRGSRKYPNCWSYSLTDRYASDNLRGAPRGSRKKPNAGRSLTRRLWTADTNSRMSCHVHAALCRDLEKSLLQRHGRGMACVNQTRPHCVNQMGKTQSKPLTARRGWGTAWYV